MIIRFYQITIPLKKVIFFLKIFTKIKSTISFVINLKIYLQTNNLKDRLFQQPSINVMTTIDLGLYKMMNLQNFLNLNKLLMQKMMPKRFFNRIVNKDRVFLEKSIMNCNKNIKIFLKIIY